MFKIIYQANGINESQQRSTREDLETLLPPELSEQTKVKVDRNNNSLEPRTALSKLSKDDQLLIFRTTPDPKVNKRGGFNKILIKEIKKQQDCPQVALIHVDPHTPWLDSELTTAREAIVYDGETSPTLGQVVHMSPDEDRFFISEFLSQLTKVFAGAVDPFSGKHESEINCAHGINHLIRKLKTSPDPQELFTETNKLSEYRKPTPFKGPWKQSTVAKVDATPNSAYSQLEAALQSSANPTGNVLSKLKLLLKQKDPTLAKIKPGQWLHFIHRLCKNFNPQDDSKALKTFREIVELISDNGFLDCQENLDREEVIEEELSQGLNLAEH